MRGRKNFVSFRLISKIDRNTSILSKDRSNFPVGRRINWILIQVNMFDKGLFSCQIISDRNDQSMIFNVSLSTRIDRITLTIKWIFSSSLFWQSINVRFFWWTSMKFHRICISLAAEFGIVRKKNMCRTHICFIHEKNVIDRLRQRVDRLFKTTTFKFNRCEVSIVFDEWTNFLHQF